MITSWDYFNLSWANEYVDDVTIPTQVIKYNQCCSKWISQSDCSIHIKFNYLQINLTGMCIGLSDVSTRNSSIGDLPTVSRSTLLKTGTVIPIRCDLPREH